MSRADKVLCAFDSDGTKCSWYYKRIDNVESIDLPLDDSKQWHRFGKADPKSLKKDNFNTK